MKKWIVLAWLLLGVAMLSFQAGPGQEALAWKTAREHFLEAGELHKEGHYDEAIEQYTESLTALPSKDGTDEAVGTANHQLRLAQLRSRFQQGRLADTIEGLAVLAKEVEQEYGPRSDMAFETREFLGRVYFHAMVALRLEAAEKEVWIRYWELARQNYRFLAENSGRKRNPTDRKNLEVVIKSFNETVEDLGAASAAASDTSGLEQLLETLEAVNPAQTIQQNDSRPRDAPEDFPDLKEWEFDLGS
jgi:hypothetical protein